ncbi:asparagine synthase (glutamine-hydrolyzing) [Puia sp.]|jgi:asparagine synthase (glutamine-hydrolysing)|uniref:asparagine synthase (glutamine-hydrolyzing) n=1 Tax=Puia sp. TaxID=2045100 RepID=UPI002F42B666
MCGIAGILNFHDRQVDPGIVNQMTDSLAHRGPDADGFWTEGAVALGHRRLSIIDLSSAANQPFFDNGGRYAMVFNGEMYNYQEVKDRLGDYAFRTTGDTEVLIAAYAKWGADCIQYFRGMYSFVIWDRQEKELFIARDRLGVKPLYFYQDNDRLLFASEIRGILASGLVPLVLDPAALIDFFSYQSVSAPESPVKGIRQLEAGCWMRINRQGQTKTQRYWDVTAAKMDVDPNDEPAIRRRIRELTLQAVSRRLVSDVPVGAFLSGGIDSSAVVGLMAEAGSSRPNTFTVAFEEKEYDESSYAELIAKKFNTVHTNILLKPTVFLDELQNALNAMDTPSGDGVNSYVVSKAIRKGGMTVALSGVGGDELFAGYPFFDQYLQLQKARPWYWLPGGLRKGLAGLALGSGPGKKDRMKQLLRLPSPSIDHSYPIFRQLLSPALIREYTTLAQDRMSTELAQDRLVTGPGRHRLAGDGPMTTVEKELARRKAGLQALPLLSQVSAAEYMGYTQHTLLKDMDQMSMAVSLEVREPFFDQDLVEFVLAVPDRWKKPVYPKSLLVESLKPLLPDEIVHRRKQGFLFPWEVWMRNELRAFCDVYINNMAQRSFINGDALTACWRRFLSGDKNIRWGEIWLFVVLEYWLEKNGIK